MAVHHLPFYELLKSSLSHLGPQVFFTISALARLNGVVTTQHKSRSLFRALSSIAVLGTGSLVVVTKLDGLLTEPSTECPLSAIRLTLIFVTGKPILTSELIYLLISLKFTYRLWNNHLGYNSKPERK